jgi:putative ABC transport system permease protein
MIRSFDAIALRQFRTRRLRALLTGFGIVLGVGMVFGVLLLVGTIRHTFDDLISSAWGKTDLVIQPHSSGVLPQSTLERAESVSGVRVAGPMIGGIFTRLDSNGEPIQGAGARMYVAGYDPAAPAYDFRYLEGRPVRSGPELVVEKNWARDRDVGVGDSVAVATPNGRRQLQVVGIFRFSSGLSFGGQGIAGMPMAEARRMTGITSGFNQIAIQATDRGNVDQLRDQLVSELGKGVRVDTPTELGEEVNAQMEGLNVVLYFFSGIAVFVGAFLILNSFNMTVLQRMRELGMLRTLGATRGMVVRTVLVEALAVGLIGSVLGLALGAGLSLGLIELMRGMGLPVGDLQFSAGSALIAVLVGLLATAAGAIWPARRAGRVPPIQAAMGVSQVRRRPSLKRGILGVALFVPALVLGGKFWFSGEAGESGLAAAAGIAGTMLMFVGIVLAAPFIIMPLVRALTVPLRRIFPTTGRLAGDAARSNPARTAATAVALTIGLSVIVVNAAMSSSFLGSISDQMDRQFARDFTVAPDGATLETNTGQSVAPSVKARISGMPEVGVATPVRGTLTKLPGVDRNELGLVMAVDPVDFPQVDRTEMMGTTREETFRGLADGGIIINRGYAEAADLQLGSRVSLRGPHETRSAPVVGVLRTMAGFSGPGMQMSLETMESVYGIDEDAQLLVKARSDAMVPALTRRLDDYLAQSHPELEAASTAEYKSRIERDINRQFNMFNAVVAIAVIISLLGVINTLAMSVLERTREIGVLRALGSSRWMVRRAMLDESLLITTSGAIAGVGIGALIGWVWVSGLDSQLPGITFHFPVGATIGVAVAAVVLGVLAAVLPARRAAKLKPVEALVYE